MTSTTGPGKSGNGVVEVEGRGGEGGLQGGTLMVDAGVPIRIMRSSCQRQSERAFTRVRAPYTASFRTKAHTVTSSVVEMVVVEVEENNCSRRSLLSSAEANITLRAL